MKVFETRKIVEFAINQYGQQQLGADLFCAISAIEIAAWDAVGKHLNTPVSNLIGGACHEYLPLYVNMFSKEPRSDEELVQEILKQKNLGFKAAKIYPYMAGGTLDNAVITTGKIRDAVGSEFGLAVDLWRASDQVRALEICRTLTQFNLLWIEDPFDTAHMRSLRRLREKIDQPLMAVETLAGKQVFHDLFSNNAVDWVNPDVCCCGGISEFRDIAALASVNHVGVSPHCFGSMTIGLAATAHAAIGIPNLELTEYYPAIIGRLNDYYRGRIEPVDGNLHISEKPGLGIEMNTDALAKFLVKS